MSLAEVVKAADFAARKHKDQRRKAADQLPYINHPIGVAHILTSEGIDHNRQDRQQNRQNRKVSNK